MNTKHALLLFSGGLDSTAVLQHLLQEGYFVDTFYVEGGQHPLKIKMEKERRLKIRDYYNERYPTKLLSDEIVSFDTFSLFVNNNFRDSKLSQPIIWLLGAMRVITERHDYLVSGYVLTDTVWQEMPAITNLWSSLKQIAFKTQHTDLWFPFQYSSKENIMVGIPPQIIQQTWTCEIPIEENNKIRMCCHCLPCKTMLKTILFDRGFDYTKQYMKAMNVPEKEIKSWVQGSLRLTVPKPIKKPRRK